MRIRGIFLLIALLQTACTSYGSETAFELSGPYLGQTPPGLTAELFAPDFISTEGSEVNSVFSPDGREFYFTTWTPQTGTKILVSRQVDGRWMAPVPATFSNHPTDVDPALNHDGSRLFFATRRLRQGESESADKGFDIWFADRTENGWAEEQFLGDVVNSGSSQVYPSVAANGTLYFQAVRDEGYGKADIYRSRLSDGRFLPPENLGAAINSEFYEGDACIAPDESFLIVTVYGRDDDLGGGDLYISFRLADGSWSPLRNMGAAVNSDRRDFSPMITPDGKYLFFSSKRAGESDLFWIDAGLIQSLHEGSHYRERGSSRGRPGSSP